MRSEPLFFIIFISIFLIPYSSYFLLIKPNIIEKRKVNSKNSKKNPKKFFLLQNRIKHTSKRKVRPSC